jgi:uncharacterized membrane protein YhaH (DUF805 family)
MTLGDKLFSFEGRLGRRDWWLLSLALAIFQMLASELIIFVLYGPSSTAIAWALGKLDSSHQTAGAVIAMSVNVVTQWPGFALIIKRRHDRDASGALFVVLESALLLITYGLQGLILAQVEIGRMALFAASLAGLAVQTWIVIGLGFLKGTSGSNRFGPSPKGLDTGVEVFD